MNKIQARESQNVEYKSSWQDEYLKWICGFANAQGAVICQESTQIFHLCGVQDRTIQT